MDGGIERMLGVAVVVACLIGASNGVTDPGDVKILNDFRDGMDNPEVLGWPVRGDDPCGPPAWPYVYCSGQRVAQIQAKGLGLKGKLPADFNQLSMLSNLGLQRNKLYGALPSFTGLSELRFAYLDYNEFDSIPSDFFDGLSSLQSFALDYNPLNTSSGWSIPAELTKSAQLANLSLMNCNLVGPLPEFLGEMLSLTELKLSYNSLSGGIPASFGGSMLQILWLNDQGGGGLSDSIDVVASMASLSQLWLHGNQFSGTIPERIGDLTSLKDLNLNMNQLVGQIPDGLANLELETLNLNNNMFVGPIPKFKARNVTYDFNSFCQAQPGIPCSPDVSALLGFLNGVGYPMNLVTRWSGNEPCEAPWFGLSCNSKGEVSIINLPRHNLSGTLSPSIANLNSLLEIRLGENGIRGRIPGNYTDLKSLRLLDLSSNNLEPPLPQFNNAVKVLVDGNPLLLANQSSLTPAPASSPEKGDSSLSPPSMISSGAASPKPAKSPPSLSHLNITVSSPARLQSGTSSGRGRYKHIVFSAAAALGVFMLASILFICCWKTRKTKPEAPTSVVIHPQDPSDLLNRIKVVVSDNTKGSMLTHSRASSGSMLSIGTENSHSIQSGNVLISVQVLRKVTGNFASNNEIGRGGFGTVYKGELHDGTKIAVKRMESGVVCGKALAEFQSEIAVLSKVSDFGLVKLAPDGERSVATRLAGTFGYLAPEYAVMGKITTKVDVFSYGVVLMELLTGLAALDNERSEETRYLAEWFWRVMSTKEGLENALDSAIEADEETLESICAIVELAGHCTAREPQHRPDMGHVVNVLVPLVEKWKPSFGQLEDNSGIDYSQPLPEMLKVWKEAESKDSSSSSGGSLGDSKGSIPARPTGFADSFTSTDAR
ncbi:hypothetical protein MLD38_008211 [Melastoma candidum]|uniref:Uncharacterized protein n=1 Tax=Melastoma candidum TaxID=119954 RepID=A0ACB9S243_9MYRT|nr:hypothetical protein MLD38_008211 [Melastoma candidum]